ncbi:MAG: hypothetical protein EZS28_024416 [Streblomastix strix]|uniref:Uncharacterized protein n=1 Tax=Streblomastix strix TaxID=222440 RepID=A0A5J4VC78_9EUKA|nr:MAG: hypothetical protein EZS28_024416 [Streblomastix strix]
MSTTEQYYEAIADYGGVEGDVKFLRVQKGDVVRLIKKKHKYLKSSGFINKIEQIIKDTIEIQKEQMKYSVETEQLRKIQIVMEQEFQIRS